MLINVVCFVCFFFSFYFLILGYAFFSFIFVLWIGVS